MDGSRDGLIDSWIDLMPQHPPPAFANPISRPMQPDTVLRDGELVCKPCEEHSGELWSSCAWIGDAKRMRRASEGGRDEARSEVELRASSGEHDMREEKGPRKP